MCEPKTSTVRAKKVVPAPWVIEELAGVSLGDRRLQRRAQIIMTQFGQQPTASIPQACGQWSDIKAAYRFFDNDLVEPEKLLAAHSQATVRRLHHHKVVLAVQDTTSLNYSTHPQTEDLGPISNNADKTIGLFVHSTLVLTPTGEPVGLLAAQVRSRDRRRFGRGRDSQARNRTAVKDKESQRWVDSLRVCQQVARDCPQTTIVNVADREGDLYELLEESLQAQAPAVVHLLIRAQHNRQVQGSEGKLWQHLGAQRAAATLQVRVPRKAGQAARTASLTIRFGPVRLCAPLLKEQKPPLSVWAIQAQEEHPPAGQKAILWRLLTTLPVTTVAEATEKVQWYCQRWQIEVFHKVLKSGCQIEHRQLETALRLRRVLMMDLIIAWRIMLLSKTARETPEASAADWLLETEWKVLWCHMKNQPLPEHPPTLRQAVRWIGQLGGFIGRKSDGEPGPIVLWRGLLRLHDLAQAWNLLKNMGNA
jgi:hypothetical protein